MSEFIWGCKIGGDAAGLPPEADGPMRAAVEAAYERVTGVDPKYCFSGWGETLTEEERAVVEDREPVRPPWRFDVPVPPDGVMAFKDRDDKVWCRLHRNLWCLYPVEQYQAKPFLFVLAYAPLVECEDPRGTS